jgi:hypothetical protein
MVLQDLPFLECLTLSVKAAFLYLGKKMGERRSMRVVHPSTK